MMTHYFKTISFLLFLFSSSIKAQEFSYGIKGSLGYHFANKLKENNTQNKASFAWQGGVFTLLDFPLFFIQPELTYSSFDANFKLKNQFLTYHNKALDLSIALGKSFLNYFRAFAGAVLSYNFPSEINFIGAKYLNKWSTAFELGAAIEYLFLIFDLRYQRAITAPKFSVKHNFKNYNLEPNTNRLMLSLAIIL